MPRTNGLRRVPKPPTRIKAIQTSAVARDAADERRRGPAYPSWWAVGGVLRAVLRGKGGRCKERGTSSRSSQADGGQERVRKRKREDRDLLDVVLPFLYSRCRGVGAQGLAEDEESCPVRVICLLGGGMFGVCSLARSLSLSRQSEVKSAGRGRRCNRANPRHGKAKIFQCKWR